MSGEHETLELGLHLVRGEALGEAGLRVPEPWIGVLDLCRMVEGHLPEPPERTPLGVCGLSELCRAAGPEALHGALAVVRGAVHDGRSYFDWKKIPLVFVLRGASLEHDPEAGGVVLGVAGGRFSLVPLFGRGLSPARPGQSDWWWSPQLG